MQGTHDPSPTDWPAPDTPLPEEEPTVELPVVSGERPPGWNGPTLARAALSLVITRREDGEDSAASPPPAASTPSSPPPPPPPPPPPAPPPSPVSSDALPGAGRDGVPAAEPGRRWLVGAGIAAAALILIGIAVVTVGRDGDDGVPDGRQWAPPAAAAEEQEGAASRSAAPPPATGHIATGPRDGRTAAALDLVDGAKTVTLRTADLGDDLYRISTPVGAPRADERDGRVQVRLDGTPDAVDVALNTRVRWDLRVAGGAQLSTIDLTGGRVGGVELSGGASRINLTLPEPDGTLSVRMSGGVSLLDVRTAGSAPVRVRLGSGASQVVLDGRTHRGVAAGRTFTPPSWAGTTDRVDVDAVAGLSALTVAPTGG